MLSITEKLLEDRIQELCNIKIGVKFRFSKKEASNAHCFKWTKWKHIKIYGNWDELDSSSEETAIKAQLFLLMTVGHELGHADSEPRILSPYFSLFRNHIRELRADFCAIIFATHYLKKYNPEIKVTREELVKLRYNYMTNHTPQEYQGQDFTHPSFAKRYEVISSNPTFNENLIRKLGVEYKANEKSIDTLCYEAMNGKILNLDK